METYDYVVVGAGSAGCILAARLSEDPRVTVLLIEAGGRDWSPWLRVPVGYARSYFDAKVNWMHYSEPEPNLGGRRVYAPRGKVVGGSGTINAMIFVRGAREDFDDWRNEGAIGWGYEDVLPYFKRLESFAGGGSAWRGDSGPIHVMSMRPQVHPIVRTYLVACEEMGLPINPDFNGATLEGAGVYDINTRQGLRSSSNFEHLRPALKRPNLRVLRNAFARRVVIDGEKRATGVEIDIRGRRETIAARAEVILAAGAVGTPLLLQHSGVGRGEDLRAAGVPVLHASPAVGQNLQDHLCASFYYAAKVPTLNDALGSLPMQAWQALRYVLTRRGPLALSVNQAGAFLRGAPDEARPNLQLYFNPLSYRIPDNPHAGLKAEPYSGFLLAFNACRPSSRGQVVLAGPDPAAAPKIQPNYLSTERDIDEALQGCKLVRRLITAPALSAITREEMPPSKAAQTDEQLIDYFKSSCGSIYHLCGTARMGADPATSVVAPDLRVHGIANLRVVDASVFPTIPSGNINAAVMMVAEKGADLVRAR